MSCQDYRPLLTRHAESGLSDPEQRLLKDHLRGCDECRRRFRLQKMDDRAIRSMLLVPPTQSGPHGRDNRLLKTLLWGAFLVGFLLMLLYTAYRWLGTASF